MKSCLTRINLWVPGGYTGVGVAEAVIKDHLLEYMIVICSYVEVLKNGSCLE